MSQEAVRASPAPDRRRGVGLGTKVVGVGALATLLVLIGFGALAWTNTDARNELHEATALLIEEERVSNRIAHAVMRQLANASALRGPGFPQGEAEFAAASQEVYELLREYLFRDLSPRERLLVERMGEDHRRLEVEAARASSLFDRREYARADLARDQMVVHVLSLLEAMDEFLDIHEERLNTLATEQDAAFRIIDFIGAGVALLFLTGTILLFWLFRTRVARPLQVLGTATEKIGMGDLDVRVPEPPEPELNTLAIGFNRMAENLQRATAALEHRNEELSAALDQVSEAQAELIQAEKLTAMGRMTAGLAHELNNPLASIIGFSQLLAEHLEKHQDDFGDEVREEILAPILREASRAQHLVLSFLNFARRPETAMGTVPLAQAVGVAQALRDHAFRQAGLTLVVEEIPECDVWAEAQMLQGVVLNVVNNALDAMAPVGEGRLVVSARLMGNDVELRFDDDGPGIAQPDRVLEPFYTTKPVGQGTGLGLALVHHFMTLFGGSVQVGNRPTGGARITLRFRITSPPPDHESPPEQPQLREEPVLTAAGYLGAPNAAPRPTVPASHQRVGAEVKGRAAPVTVSQGIEPADPSRPRILVVEDEASLRLLHKRILGRLEAVVFLAAEGAEARRILSEVVVDLVLSDVKMPGESGLDLYRWIERERPELLDRFLFVTGDVSDPELVALAERRPELFLRKPFEVEEYLARVADLLD